MTDISDIIGKGKKFKPPFYANIIDEEGIILILDKGGLVLLGLHHITEENIEIAAHLCELLNERWQGAKQETMTSKPT